MLLMLVLSKAGPGGAAVAGSQSPGPLLRRGSSAARSPQRAKAQRARGGIAEIVRKVFAIDGMSLVLTIAYTDAL